VGERAEVDNASDVEQVTKADRRAKDARAMELNDLRAVLATKEGRRLLWRLLSHCKAFRSVFDENPLKMGHLSGRQDVGHFIMHEIEKAKPDAFGTMMREHTNQET
jgi:hypothetical protein